MAKFNRNNHWHICMFVHGSWAIALSKKKPLYAIYHWIHWTYYVPYRGATIHYVVPWKAFHLFIHSLIHSILFGRFNHFLRWLSFSTPGCVSFKPNLKQCSHFELLSVFIVCTYCVISGQFSWIEFNETPVSIMKRTAHK